jgi:hypothetical protein
MSVRASLLLVISALPLSAAAVQTIKPKEIGLSLRVWILMIQTDNPNRELNSDFENAVMQAVIE